jgi:hypothetical protein
MADTAGLAGSAVYLLPGMRVKISSDLTPKNNMGYRVKLGSVRHQMESGSYQEFDLLRGFLVEDETVGTIEATDSLEAGIWYTHNRPERNIIWFYAETGERGYIEIVAVPIHDHSTIVQGGPAYGTYFADDEVIT